MARCGRRAIQGLSSCPATESNLRPVPEHSGPRAPVDSGLAATFHQRRRAFALDLQFFWAMVLASRVPEARAMLVTQTIYCAPDRLHLDRSTQFYRPDWASRLRTCAQTI